MRVSSERGRLLKASNQQLLGLPFVYQFDPGDLADANLRTRQRSTDRVSVVMVWIPKRSKPATLTSTPDLNDSGRAVVKDLQEAGS